MSEQSFKNYGLLASPINNFTKLAGRYNIQDESERLVIMDIINKLEINNKDDLLEIGCGAGNLLIPLSFFVNRATGVDHPQLIKRLNNRFNDHEKIETVCGNFLQIDKTAFTKHYTKILIYSVIHYLSNEDELKDFIQKSLSILSKGGKLLIGDIPNISKKNRFIKSETGKTFKDKWDKLVNEKCKNVILPKSIEKDMSLICIDDNIILQIVRYFREKGYNVFILPQDFNLPFGYTREDILIESIT